MFKKKTLLSLLAVVTLTLTGCSTNNGEVDVADTTPAVEEQEETVTEETTTEETDVSASEYDNVKITPAEAFDIYMDKHPTTLVKKVQLDKDLGNFVYKVEGFEANMEYELKIDPIDGSIIKEHSESDNDMDEMEIKRDHVMKVATIVDEALTDAGPDAKVEEWTIEMDDGIPQLDIEIDKKGLENEERTYNVDTGQLVEIDN